MQFFQVTVDSLHKSLVDSQMLFKDCASSTKNDLWKQKFEHFAVQREQMMRDLEIYGGASKAATGTMMGGLSRAWMDMIAAGGGQEIESSISREELSLKKAYDDAVKSHGIASSLNGLLRDHLRKIDADVTELHSLFGTESKFSAGQTVNTIHTGQRKQSISDMIKSTFGIGTQQGHALLHNTEVSGAAISNNVSTKGQVEQGHPLPQNFDQQTQYGSDTVVSKGQVEQGHPLPQNFNQQTQFDSSSTGVVSTKGQMEQGHPLPHNVETSGDLVVNH